VTGDFVLRAVVDCASVPVPLSRDWGPALLVGVLAAIGLLASLRSRSNPARTGI